MTNRKIIFIDIDGTLIDYRQMMPSSAAVAIKNARKNGHKIYICTGRSKSLISPELWNIGWDGIIGGNGCFIEDKGQSIFHQMIPLQSVEKAINWFASNSTGFYEESNTGIYASQNFIEQATSIYGDTPEEAQQRVRRLFPELVVGGNLCRQDINKINFIWNPDWKLDTIRKKFHQEFLVNTWSLTGKPNEFGEFGLPGINKGKAIDLLLTHLGESQANSIAFGDAISDMEMLQFCEIGVAMGNARQELKEIADFVTAKVDEDGLLKAFKHFGLV